MQTSLYLINKHTSLMVMTLDPGPSYGPTPSFDSADPIEARRTRRCDARDVVYSKPVAVRAGDGISFIARKRLPKHDAESVSETQSSEAREILWDPAVTYTP